MSDVASVFAIMFYIIAAVSLVLLARNYFKGDAELEKSNEEFIKRFKILIDEFNDIDVIACNTASKTEKLEADLTLYEANFSDQKKRIDKIYQKWSEVNRKLNLLDERLSCLDTRILALEKRLEGAVMIVNANDSIIVEPPDETFKITNADYEYNVKPVEEVKED